MTDQQAVAIAKALQYLITSLVAVPKTTAAKQKRAELLQALTNASRPMKESPKADAPAHDDNVPAGGAIIPRLEISMMLPPDGDTATVRPGTVKSLPVTGAPIEGDAT